MHTPYRATPDTYVIPMYETLPGIGLLPMNAYLIQGQEPVLIDTGMTRDREHFLKTLWNLIEPKDLKWIFMTHEDKDHTGSLQQVLEAAPQARLVTSWLGVGKLMSDWVVPVQRVLHVNHGQSVKVGDRTIRLIKPPVYDSPSTASLYDDRTGALFTSDAFGAFLQNPANDLAAVPEKEWRSGFNDFNLVNHPWVSMVDRERFEAPLKLIRELNPSVLLSSHLPAARGWTEALLEAMAALPTLPPFNIPDQQAIEAMMARLSAEGTA